MSSSDSTGSSSAPGSPRNRLKFLCSHGGRILPRPPDGCLKYVGGETRVFSVPRDITFLELMKKVTTSHNNSGGVTILKYQLASEDLDALISVKSDEDVRHMLEEIDGYESAGIPRLRAFLFNAVAAEKNVVVDGVRRNAPSKPSSACTSPRSVEETGEGFRCRGRGHMYKVHSSPNICGSPTHVAPHHSNCGGWPLSPGRMVPSRPLNRGGGAAGCCRCCDEISGSRILTRLAKPGGGGINGWDF